MKTFKFKVDNEFDCSEEVEVKPQPPLCKSLIMEDGSYSMAISPTEAKPWVVHYYYQMDGETEVWAKAMIFCIDNEYDGFVVDVYQMHDSEQDVRMHINNHTVMDVNTVVEISNCLLEAQAILPQIQEKLEEELL